MRIPSSLVFSSLAAFVSYAAPAQSPLVIGGVPNASTAVGGALAFDFGVWTPVTLTQIDFSTGAGTLLGSSVSISIFLNAGYASDALTPGRSVLIGTTVPVVTTVAGPQAITGAVVVPAAPFAAVTIPSSMYGLTLRGNNCSLGANTGALTAVNAELSVHGGIAVSVFPFGGPGATLTNNRTFAGVLRYTLGGTPINLQENASYGSSCFGLGLTAAGVPTPGGTLLFTTSNPTNQSVGLCLLSTDLVPGFPNGLDLTFLGAPGCLALVDPNAGFATVISNLGAPVPGMSVSLSLPAIPGYLGLPIYAQSVWLDATLNAFGIATSNGVRIRIG